MAEASPVCLVAGCNVAGKSSIISAICGRSAGAKQDWTIDTKYYSARVTVVEHAVPHSAQVGNPEAAPPSAVAGAAMQLGAWASDSVMDRFREATGQSPNHL